jgi:hypothetical protein
MTNLCVAFIVVAGEMKGIMLSIQQAQRFRYCFLMYNFYLTIT